MKKYVSQNLVGLLVITVLCSSAYAQNKKDFSPTFPQFEFYKPNGELFTNQNLQKGKATIVIFFDPDCDHCQKQASWIAASPESFKNAQLLWVSTAEANAINTFGKTYFPKFPAPVYFVKDKNYKFDSYFGYSVAPTILVYSSTGQLQKSFKNEVAVAELVKYIK
jgi:thiol-disulfide isomerase/thioredoxin